MDVEKKSALSYATEEGTCVWLLEFQLPNHLVSLKWVCLPTGFDKIVRYLIENGANIDLRDKEGNTPLITAAKNGILNWISKLN